MARLAAVTYGPTPGTVAIDRLVGSGPPEVLDSAATVARRTIELADPFENAGGMLVRDTVLRVHERVGDGGALTALLLLRLLMDSGAYLAGGGDPQALRRGLQDAIPCALSALEAQVRSVDDSVGIAHLIASFADDPDLADLLAEVLDSVGPDGVVLVEAGEARQTTREYLDGVRWDSGYLSPYFVTDGSGLARVRKPAILITQSPITRADQLVRLLEECCTNARRQLLIVAPELRDSAAGLLLLNRERGVLESVLAVKAPGPPEQHAAILEDLAVLTGARCLRTEAGDRPESVCWSDLGRARQAWAGPDTFGILGPAGDRGAIRKRMISVRAEQTTVRDTPALRRTLEHRLANLAGVAAVVRVGGVTDTERDERRLRVCAAMQAGRLALRDGVVPGGGAALFRCAQALGTTTPAERILQRALRSPLRSIARLAGCDPATVAVQACDHPGAGFDVIRRVWSTALVDPFAIVSAALEAAVSAAATAVTTEAVVRRTRTA